MSNASKVRDALPSAWDVRRDDAGALDEIVGTGFVHLEQMDDGHWWMGLGELPDCVHVDLIARLQWPVRRIEGAWDWVGWVRIVGTATRYQEKR